MRPFEGSHISLVSYDLAVDFLCPEEVQNLWNRFSYFHWKIYDRKIKKKINNIVVTQFFEFIGWYSKWVLTLWKTPHCSRRHQQNVKLWNPKNLKYIRLWCNVLHTVVFNRPTDPKTMDDNFFINFLFFFKS